MKPFYLAEIVTRDKLIHQGLFYNPRHPSKRALLFVHGLTSTFYGGTNILEEFAKTCEKPGLGLAIFNNRGHDMVTGMRKIDRRKPKGYTNVLGGAGFERFKDCVFDIDAGVGFLVKEGYSEVVVVGFSTGANKVCYYAATHDYPHVIGFILASPVSDRLTITDKERLKKDLARMQDLVNEGKGKELQIGYHFFPLTPIRFLSLFTPNSTEDTFDYGDPRPRFTYFSKITKSLLVILAEKDESLDRSASEVLRIFTEYQTSVNFKSVIIPDTLHSFSGKEAEVATEVVTWVTSL